jgi:predicted DNA-binding protein (UPF0251 family)
MSAATTIAPAHPALPTTRPSVEPDRVEQREREAVRGVDSQCMQALARANQVRLARAALKRDIGAGRRNVIDTVIERPWEVESMTLSELLRSQRRWGRARARKLLTSIGLSEGKRLGTLTERQVGILVRALQAKSVGQPLTTA